VEENRLIGAGPQMISSPNDHPLQSRYRITLRHTVLACTEPLSIRPGRSAHNTTTEHSMFRPSLHFITTTPSAGVNFANSLFGQAFTTSHFASLHIFWTTFFGLHDTERTFALRYSFTAAFFQWYILGLHRWCWQRIDKKLIQL
jgi:hypothetical protein